MNQDIQQQDPGVRRPIIRRVIIMLVTFLMSFIVLAAVGIISSLELRLTDETASTLSLTEDALREKITQYRRDVRLIVTSPDLQKFVINDNDPINEITVPEALSTAATLVTLHNDEYQAVRYIVTDDAPRITLEVNNISGVPIFSSNEQLALLSATRQAADPVFQALQNGSITGVQLSDIYLLQNADGNDSVVPVMSVYQPVVYQTSELAGILELQIDMQQFLATVNNAENTLFTALTGRRLLLVNEAYRLLADSRNQTRYLSRFDDVALPVSEYDFMIAELDANDTRAWSDRNFVYRIAGQQIAFDEASTVWHLIYIDEFVSAYRPAILAIVSIISLSILLGIAAYSVLTRQISQILQPVYLASGLIQDLATATGVNTRPENSAPLDKLEQVSRNVENRIRDLNSTIESEQIQRRRDLQLVRRVSYAINDPQSAYDVPVHAVKVITTELNISSAVIYRLDTSRTHIQTIAAYHHNDEQIPDTAISVDTKTFVGTVIRRNHPIIIADTLQSVYQDNSRHLPETRSELGLPLIIEGTLPGALILQSNEIDAFSEVDLPVYQLIADQLATAMFNQGLQDTAAQRFEQVKHLNQQLTARAWAETGNRDQLADKYGTLPDNGSLAAPITVRGQVIGSLDAALPDNRDLTAGDKVVLSAVAERVSLAVENARLFQETQHSLAETSTLYQLSRQLTETGNLEDILRVVIISVAPDAVGGQIWLFDEYLPGDEPDIVRLAIDLPVNDRNYNLQDIMLRMREEPLLSGIQADQILAIPDIAQKARSGEGQLSELFEVLDVESVMIFPLNIRNRWKGFVSIDFADARQFTESERRIYNTLIGQAGVAIDNRLLIQQTENALSRNEKLYAASRIINTAAGLDDLVYAALSTTNDHALSFWLALLEDGTENDRGWATRARIVARSDKDDVDTTEIIYDLPLTDHSPLYNREPEVIVDPGYEAGDVSPSVEWMRSMNLQFMMAFPLFSENTPIALFYIVSETPYVLTSEDYEVYSALTGQMSTRIQSQRFLESTRKALSDVQRLYAATRALTAATDLEDLYSAIAGHLARPFLTGQHSGLQLSITLLQAAPRPQTTAPYLEYIYEWHTQPDTPPLFEIGTKLPHQDYPFGELSRNFEENTFIYGDIVAEVINTGLQTILQGHQSQSAIVAPLHYRQSWYGVLICRSNQPQLFDESYANFMQAIASQVAVAFERQELVAENDRERQNLNDILSTLSAGVLVLDPDTLIPVQANDAASELLGQPIDYNHPFTAAHYDIYRTGTNLHYPDSELPVMLARQLNRSVPGDDLAVIFDDYRIDLQISAAPIYDESNRMKAIVAAFLDISNLRGLENTLQEQLRESVSLYEALRSLSQSESLAELLDNILLQLTLQQPEDAYILRVDENAENLRVERELVQAIQPIEALAPLLITEHANYVPDVQLEAGINDSLRNILDEAGIRSIITLPMFARSLQIPIGWLVLCSGYPHDFSPEQERTLVSISDMASTAIDNRYLMEQTESALDETAALYGANTSISRASDLDELSIALQRGLAGMQPDMYAAYLTLDDGETIGELFSIGFEESIAAGMDMNTLVTGKLNSGDTMYVADITRSTLGTVEREIIKAGNIISFAAINIRLKDVNSGRLIVGYKTRRNFGSSDARFLTAIAGSASVVINNEILLGQVQTALQETSILYQASRSLIEVSTPEEIMEAITTHLIEPHVNQVYIMMLNTTSWDHPAASVEIVSSWQQDSDIDLLDVTLTPEQFPAWTQLSSSEVLTIHDIYDSDPEIDLLEQTSIESLDTRSLVVIPLRVASRAIGAIWMGSREAHRYPDDRQRIFQAFSEQSSLSLEATRLLEQTEQRAAQLETSAVISRSVGQILDLDILLPQVVDLIKAQFKYDQVQIFLMDNENNRAVLQASTGESGLQLLAVNHSLAIGSQSIIGQVTATGQPAVALDTADASVIHKPNPYLPLTRSEMAMPLLAKNEIVGALDVQSNEPDAFTDEDIQALTALAAQISVAIDNARLYEEAQRQAMDMNFLFEMTALVASMESIDDALTLLAERLEDNLNALSVAMYLPQVYADYQDNTITRMRLVTLTGQSSAYPSDFDEIEVGAGDNIVGIVSDTLQAYHVINVSEDVLYTPFVRTARSAYIVPVSSA
ncbi:MAG: GAF domain-containing protein, partial [Aggregatilineales bacterium]